MLFSATKKQKINLKLKDTFEPNLGQIAKKGPFASCPFICVGITYSCTRCTIYVQIMRAKSF